MKPAPAAPSARRRRRGYTLYGYRGSGSAAVEAALELAGARYRIVKAASWDRASAIGRLEKLNPLGQVPTLVLPDGSVMTESAAILIHLGLAHPASRLMPARPAARAQAIRGLVFIAANCYSAVGVTDHPGRWYRGADEAAKERVRRAARGQLHRSWEIFADRFPARPFLSGRAPGALDILAAVVSGWSGARAHLGKARPEFLATLLRIESHPRVSRVFARHRAPA